METARKTSLWQTAQKATLTTPPYSLEMRPEESVQAQPVRFAYLAYLPFGGVPQHYGQSAYGPPLAARSHASGLGCESAAIPTKVARKSVNPEAMFGYWPFVAGGAQWGM
mmetsp:Transcript_135114/g.263145  ORF Transcript_135114/g.263145 Transcript_135114/m.263145 type:complete len:110 (-) Transcript_135114:37-366(-)